MPAVAAAGDVAAAFERFERPGFARLTAADRPGVAQPVPEREIPAQPWGAILVGALLLFLALLAGWEAHWRAFGATPGYRNSDGAWAEQRRRIDRGEGDATVLIGTSRMLFDVQLADWEAVTGERPIQLALEGTSPMPVLEDLAADPGFTGRLLIDASGRNLFTGTAGRRANVVPYFHEQGPSQRSGHWLSQRFLEPYLAFYDPDYALATVVRRQAWWPDRPGLPPRLQVRKLSKQGAARNTWLWDKVERDPEYRALVRRIWRQALAAPVAPMLDTPGKRQAAAQEQIARIGAAVDRLRARGVRVAFLSPPVIGPWRDTERREAPRAQTWDPMLRRTRVPGIHFEDHPQLQGYALPEWSHLSHADARRFTRALAPLAEQAWREQSPRPDTRR